ncbi:Acyl-CoA-binding domain-containing protein 2 [Carex littledalei]|uniref:Acyl-CoA-binding domain-containing protein 2 n=1 Tax=Carex littledalei TaxID=544730 RepID=A0A833VDV7_9POAL|nr:Acyl-CoA-binding domain-containing protein 2 [Carex littledalei]
MGDWQELGQAVFIGLIFSFLVAKLISIAISFKESNLKLTRSVPDPEPVSEPQPEPETEIYIEETPIDTTSVRENIDTSIVDSDTDSDSWEGIEGTELDEEFSAASAFVATMAATSDSARVSSELQLKLYGLYKIATEGPCTAPQPSALSFTARAKCSLDAIHIAAREGARDDLLKQLDSGVSVNLKEGEGRTPLHWAVDRGHVDIVKELLKTHADVNAKDNEGQTPLHYAVVCDRETISELLVKHGADPQISDNDGNSPVDLCDSKWPFMITE